jgi:hypothetical protein
MTSFGKLVFALGKHSVSDRQSVTFGGAGIGPPPIPTAARSVLGVEHSIMPSDVADPQSAPLAAPLILPSIRARLAAKRAQRVGVRGQGPVGAAPFSYPLPAADLEATAMEVDPPSHDPAPLRPHKLLRTSPVGLRRAAQGWLDSAVSAPAHAASSGKLPSPRMYGDSCLTTHRPPHTFLADVRRYCISAGLDPVHPFSSFLDGTVRVAWADREELWATDGTTIT